jgi:hypothetical protein
MNSRSSVIRVNLDQPLPVEVTRHHAIGVFRIGVFR